MCTLQNATRANLSINPSTTADKEPETTSGYSVLFPPSIALVGLFPDSAADLQGNTYPDTQQSASPWIGSSY
ncbi:hypothetical protein ABFA07_014036 [Porites harrisoni]